MIEHQILEIHTNMPTRGWLSATFFFFVHQGAGVMEFGHVWLVISSRINWKKARFPSMT